MKTSLATATASGKTIDDVLLSLRSTPTGPNLPSPREILHNHTEEHPGQPSHQVDYEQIRNYLLNKKATQKEYHDKSHNAKPLSELEPQQKVLFLSPREENQYIKGTITTKAPTPKSYYIEFKGKTYCHTCQHIHTINTEIPLWKVLSETELKFSSKLTSFCSQTWLLLLVCLGKCFPFEYPKECCSIQF